MSANYLNWTREEIEESIENMEAIIEGIKAQMRSDGGIPINHMKSAMNMLNDATTEKNDMLAFLRGADEERVRLEEERREIKHLKYKLAMYEDKFGKISMEYEDVIALEESLEVRDED